MIKAVSSVGGRQMLFVGLEGENMARLMSDEPIRISHEQLLEMLGLDYYGAHPIEIVIFGGKDNDSLHAQLAPLIEPDTRVVGT